MAPEYLVRGRLTEKADIFSFGVLLIEVITGRRNSSRSEDPISTLQEVMIFFVVQSSGMPFGWRRLISELMVHVGVQNWSILLTNGYLLPLLAKNTKLYYYSGLESLYIK